MESDTEFLIGVMSGTSMDGADAVLAAFQGDRIEVIAHHHLPYRPELQQSLYQLQSKSDNELEHAQLAALQLAHHYASVVLQLISKAGVERKTLRAVAVHGQTIRHRPSQGFTLQLNAPAQLAELLGVDVICDFRARDVAAGGQGAPLVPAFHAAVFGAQHEHRAVLNLGGMANLTDLPPGGIDQHVTLRGWDTGPGNVLLDHWFKASHPDSPEQLDREGAFAARGRVDQALLARLLDDPWFDLPPPKSTGREQFDVPWLSERLPKDGAPAAADVQATLAQLTAETVADMLAREIPKTERLLVCGGGVYNKDLMARLESAVARRLNRSVAVVSSEALGVLPEHVEAAAFAWLGHCFLHRRAGNSVSVTGARGARVLGALYPG